MSFTYVVFSHYSLTPLHYNDSLARRPQSQLPCQLHRSPAVQGEQEGVREESQSLCGAQLDRGSVVVVTSLSEIITPS